MALTPGTRVGAYDITGLIGAGGMGEVYRARDSKLKREVAIKVLPADVAADPERLARFQREAEVLASLNHPHIAHVYGIENGALVMELVEGEDLSQRIARGPIPIDEALPIARQIAEALETAHDAGIVHRDLKPANIKVRDDGTVKVLDFGLAKALESGAGNREPAAASALANSPTITSPAMTQRGVILGTAAYMSPEQAKGKAVDRRTDIWAFGCVLYEMLTGKRAFAGSDVSDMLVSILRDDPRWVDLPSNTPPQVKLLLRRCLQKDPQKRLPHIGAARLELVDADTGELVRAAPSLPNRWYVPAVVGAAAGAAAVAVLAFALRSDSGSGVDRPAVRFTIDAPDGSIFPGAGGVPRFALSPDGRRMAYQLQDANSVRLFVRPLDQIDAESVAGETQAEATAGSVPGGNTQQPFWSPDGLTLAFFDDATQQMKKHDLRTKLTDVITEVPGNQMCGTWHGDAILFSSLLTGGIRHVRPSGDGQRQITTVDSSKKETAHLWPEFLGDGRHFVYLATFADGTPSALHISSIDGGSARKLFDSPTGARFAWPDRLMFVRDGALVSQRLDLQTLSPLGQPDLIASAILFTPAGRIGVSTAARANVIAYAAGGGPALGEGFETRWVDRAGIPVSGAPPSVVIGINGVRLAAHGRTLLYARTLLANRIDVATSLWAQDTQRGIETRLSDTGAPGTHAVASPDGALMVHRQYEASRISLMLLPLSGTTPAARLFTGEFGEGIIPFDWTARNELLFFAGARGDKRAGLWLLPVTGDRRPIPFLAGIYPLGASVSPDGRWIAYAAGGAIATAQVFVQPFPDPALGKWPVSAVGGAFPRWRADGGELFYVDSRRQLMAASFKTSPQVEIGNPVLLFGDVGADRSAAVAYPYDVMPDGKRFVVMRPRGSSQQTAQIVVDVK